MPDPMPLSWLVAALRVEADGVEGVVRRPSLDARVQAWRQHARNLEQLAEQCRRHADETLSQIEDRVREQA